MIIMTIIIQVGSGGHVFLGVFLVQSLSTAGTHVFVCCLVTSLSQRRLQQHVHAPQCRSPSLWAHVEVANAVTRSLWVVD
jgi:hypothetical protein